MTRTSTRRLLRRKLVPLTLAWSIAWLIGLSSLAWLALRLQVEKSDRQLEDEMGLYAMALYGIAWFDEDTTFHDGLLRREPLIATSPFDLWVVRPGETGWRYDLRPQPRRFHEPDFAALRSPVLDRVEETWAARTVEGDQQIVLATPAFATHDDERPIAILAVVASYATTQESVDRFRGRLLTAVALLGSAGLLVGIALSWWSLAPAIASLRQREAFLAGAAHELRTPLATLGSIVDGARSGVESPDTAIGRLRPVLDEANHLVSDLLLFARLDGGHEAIRREPLRLDLLVETTIPEPLEETLRLDLPPIEVDADPRLATVAIRNLLANSLEHGGGVGVVVAPVPGGIVVTDQGPGYPPEILAASRGDDLRFLPSNGGVGAGLALVHLIARLHGGGLTLRNRESGGARAELVLAARGPAFAGTDDVGGLRRDP